MKAVNFLLHTKYRSEFCTKRFRQIFPRLPHKIQTSYTLIRPPVQTETNQQYIQEYKCSANNRPGNNKNPGNIVGVVLF